MYYVRIFPDSSLHHLFVSENLRFPFSLKNSLIWRVKSEKSRENVEKLNFRRPYEIYWINLNGTVI